MPKFTVQFLRSTGAVADPTTDTTDKLKRWVVGVNLVSGHHSNGGETCEFVDEDPDNECQSSLQPPPAPEDREFMVTPGNFSTNYFELGVNVRRVQPWNGPRESCSKYRSLVTDTRCGR